MKELDSAEIKKELVCMLSQVDKFFKENKICYSITSGTLLGAVRHKGFIPWDDDIDISILRTDYNRLIGLLKKENKISDNLKGVSFELGNSHLPFIKIVNINIKTTEFVTDGVYDEGNLWIDIFPMDAMPKHFVDLNTKFLDKFLRRIYEAKRITVEFPKMISDSKFFKLASLFSFDKITSLFIKKCSRFNIKKCDFVRDFTWGNTTMPKYFMDNIIDYDFEGIKVKGLANYDEYLTGLYHNYMELPPVDKRVSHGVRAWKIDEETL